MIVVVKNEKRWAMNNKELESCWKYKYLYNFNSNVEVSWFKSMMVDEFL